MSAAALIELRNVGLHYCRGGLTASVFDGLSLDIAAGRSVGVSGPSGSGKTTLLNLCAGLQRPTSGDIIVDGVDLGALSQGELDRLRIDRIGYVFQSLNLIPALSALENVEVALRLAGKLGAQERHARTTALLDRVGLADRMHHMPSELSFGQMQRVGIARALANRPRLLLADEPTASLEPGLARSIAELLLSVAKETGATLLLASHDPAILDMMEDRISLGRLTSVTAGAA